MDDISKTFNIYAQNKCKASSKSNFIIIESKHIYTLLFPLAKRRKDANYEYILDYKVDLIRKILAGNNIDFDNFCFMGHVYYWNKMKFDNKILLVNKSLCKPPDKYEKKLPFDSGYIYEPKHINYIALGMIYISEWTKFNSELFGVINTNSIKMNSVDKNINKWNNKIFTSEYNLLSTYEISHRIANFNKFNICYENVLDIDNDLETFVEISGKQLNLTKSVNPWFDNTENEIDEDILDEYIPEMENFSSMNKSETVKDEEKSQGIAITLLCSILLIVIIYKILKSR